MSQDRYVKVLLTVIAVALSVLALAQLEALPAARAADSSTATEGHEVGPPGGAALPPQEATPAPPIRWRIPHAQHGVAGDFATIECATVVSVLSFSPEPFDVEVEFFDDDADSVGAAGSHLEAGEKELVQTDGNIDIDPFALAGSASTGTFLTGYAVVLAEDPRIAVDAHLVCWGEDAIIPDLIIELAAYPAGSTARFFQAGKQEMAPMTPRTEAERALPRASRESELETSR